MSVDLVDFILGGWLKPFVWMFFLSSVAKHSFRYSASKKHVFLVYALFAIVIGVAVHFFAPEVMVPILPGFVSELVAYDFIPALDNIFLWQNLPLLIGVLFVFGFFWIVFFQLFAIIDAYRLTGSCSSVTANSVQHIVSDIAQRWSINKRILIVQSAQLRSPVVFGFIRPVLILPQNYTDWSRHKLERILMHELCHIRRNDWLCKLCVRFLCALLWFVPPVWWLSRNIEWYAELACDDAVILESNCRADYAKDLIDMESDLIQNAWLISFIKQSQLYSRIEYVLDARPIRGHKRHRQSLHFFLLCLILVIPFSFLHAGMIADDAPRTKLLVVDLAKVLDKKNTVDSEPADSHFNVRKLKPLLFGDASSENLMEEVSVTSYSTLLNNSNALVKTSFSSFLPTVETVSSDMSSILAAGNDLAIKGFVPQKFNTPVYPKKALMSGIEGVVTISFDVDIDGAVENIMILESRPRGVFDRSVTDAMKKSRYIPMRIGGDPVTTKNIKQTYIFQLNKSTAIAQ